jgi:opine dehydrogenase
MLALQEERDRLAAALGLRVPMLAESLHRASGVPLRPLPEMGPSIAATGRSVNGPASMDTRYVTEDVPYGLAFYLWLAARQGIAMPRTEATVTVLEALWQRDLRSNPVLDMIGTGNLAVLLRDGVGRA